MWRIILAETREQRDSNQEENKFVVERRLDWFVGANKIKKTSLSNLLITGNKEGRVI